MIMMAMMMPVLIPVVAMVDMIVIAVVVMIVSGDRVVDALFEIGAFDREYDIEVKFGILSPADSGDLVQSTDLLFDPIQFVGGHKVGLVENDEIRKGDLLARFGRFL